MTLEIKGYPFEVLFPDKKSAVLADQVKCLDWRFRNVQAFGHAPEEVIQGVRDILRVLLHL